MRSLLAALLIAVLPAVSTADSFRPVYEHGSGELVLDLAFGSEDENDDAFIMSTWFSFAVAPNGDVYVLESQRTIIKRFNADGELLAEWGEEGEGPGSMLMPSRIAVGPDGRVWVYELGNRRFSIFGPEGEFVAAHAFMDGAWAMDVSPQGRLYAKVQLGDFTGEWGGSRHNLLRFEDDIETYTVVDSALIKDNIYITEPRHTNVPVPFHDEMPTTKDTRILSRSPKGEAVYDVRHDMERLPVTEEEKERHFANMGTTVNGVMTKGAPDYIRDATEFPRHKPPFRLMLVDHEGYVLLMTWEGDDNSSVWLVFEPDGEFLRRVSLEGMGRAVLAGGFVYQTHQEDDLNTVRRSRLVIPEKEPPNNP
jgi:hypothetical protein